MKNTLKMSGIFELEKFKNGKRIKYFKDENMIMDNTLSLLTNLFVFDEVENLVLKHVEFGDNGDASTENMSSLNNPFFRTKILTNRKTGVGTVTIRSVMTDLQPENLGGIAEIKEVGLFAGKDSQDFNLLADHLGTGILISRKVVNESKDLFEQIQVTWTLKLERV